MAKKIAEDYELSLELQQQLEGGQIAQGDQLTQWLEKEPVTPSTKFFFPASNFTQELQVPLLSANLRTVSCA